MNNIFFEKNFDIDYTKIHEAIEGFSTFNDLSHLALLALEKIKENIRYVIPSLYIHDNRLHNFHNIFKDNTLIIDEDSILINFLTKKNTIISIDELKKENFFY